MTFGAHRPQVLKGTPPNDLFVHASQPANRPSAASDVDHDKTPSHGAYDSPESRTHGGKHSIVGTH
jgi:hypothetical protein